MRACLVAVVAVALALPSPAAAFWGQKNRSCPRWVATLDRLEQAGQSASTRARILRNRIADGCVALNEIQVLGSHNSYHIEPRPELMQALLDLSPVFEAWQYTHDPLGVQFETQGIRQIEIDVFADPNGGLFARRGGLIAVNEDPNSGIPELDQPGFKVLHIQDLDFETTCLTFVDCLRDVKAWSDAHPRHLPIMILVEAKDDTIPDIFGSGFAIPVPLGPAEFDALDAEIRTVFPLHRIITPDDVRRTSATLEEAVLAYGWPRLGAVRGKVLFMLDDGGHYRADYLAGHPSLRGRILFADSSPGDDWAAFVKANDPLNTTNPTISELVAAGYFVRTRTDADTVEARSGDTGPRDAAISSGAQMVSTDYPIPDPDFGTGYVVAIPGGMPARCNPINGPAGCRAEALERIR
jgi:hypothetical protein